MTRPRGTEQSGEPAREEQGRLVRLREWLRTLGGTGLGGKALRGSGWTLLNIAGRQALRLVSNVVLARILAPEDFGTMALVIMVQTGLTMFSDLGIGSSIVQDDRGDDPVFLNTAFSIQVVRGFILSVLTLLLAVPVANAYGIPRLGPLIAAVSIGPAIEGFHNIRLDVMRRTLQFGLVVRFELLAQLLGLVVTLLLALVLRSVWALVIGLVAGQAIGCLLSYRIVSSEGLRLGWDPKVARSIISFGSWIFLSTAAGFVISQGDRVTLGFLMSEAQLGRYNIAQQLAGLPLMVLGSISQSVLFPVYARLDSTVGSRRKVLKMRAVLTAVFGVFAGCLVFVAAPMIDLLYDDRYSGAARYLALVSSCTLFLIPTRSAGSILLARGDSRSFSVILMLRGSVQLILMVGLGSVFGPVGLITATGLAEVVAYPVLARGLKRYDVWFPWLDIGSFAVASVHLVLVLIFLEFV